MGVATDLTERKMIEENIRRYSEIEAKNKEMEQFSYVASHDLQEPLQTITNFASLLQRKYTGKLDASADTYLQYLLQASDRMRELIKGLLDYSQLGHAREAKTVDCNVVLKNVLDGMVSVITRAGAVVEAGPLPVVHGYRAELESLFQNLISNAIIYHRQGVPPVIKISAEKKRDNWQFKIEDNGIGILEENYKKIFKIFKRLHTRSEVEGHGLGLAHSEKIVAMHNGTIWVKSVYGKGSTFYFTLKA